MGTYYKVTMVLDAAQQENTSLSLNQLKAAIDLKLEVVNEQMSTYRPDSELSTFNKSTDSLTVSPATRSVVQSALDIYQQSEGAFDITVGPLVNLWGFGPDKRVTKAPSQAVIDAKLADIGSQYLSITGNTLHKDKADLYLDLSAIAKGYGVDVVAEYLQSLGIDNYLVDIGGELRANGMKTSKQPWTLAVETPTAGEGIQRVIHIGNNAIATSGDYRNYFEDNGIRYSHTIDPKTGKPISHKLVSVTVVYPNCKMADGYATAITVLGPQAGFEFAKKHNLAVFLLVKKGEIYQERYTLEFESYFVKD